MLDMAALQVRVWVERRRKTERGGSVPARPVGLLVFLSAAGFLLPPPPGELHSPPLPSTSRHAELDEQKRGGEKRRLRGLAEAHAHNGSAVFGSYGGGHGARLRLPANFRFP